MTAICLVQPAAAQTRTVAGQFGLLGEWDLTATLTKQTAATTLLPLAWKTYHFGPVRRGPAGLMRHAGRGRAS